VNSGNMNLDLSSLGDVRYVSPIGGWMLSFMNFMPFLSSFLSVLRDDCGYNYISSLMGLVNDSFDPDLYTLT
jgi:hypothetical protein